MAAFEIIANIVKLIAAIKDVSDTVDSNRTKCARLASRVNALNGPLNNLEVSVENEELLMNLTALLKEIGAFMSQFKRRDFFSISFLCNDDRDKFLEFSGRLDSLTHDLHLGLEIDAKKQADEYQADLKADNEEMKRIVYKLAAEFQDARRHQDSRTDEILRALMSFQQTMSNYSDQPQARAINRVALNTVDLNFLRCNIDDQKTRLSYDPDFGSTYRGYYHSYRMDVAVKTIRNLEVPQEKLEAAKLALYREAVILQKYNGFPGVLKYAGVDDSENPTAIVTELPICTLEQLLYDGAYYGIYPLTFVNKLKLLSDCANFFVFLSRIGVIHRDICPGNIVYASGSIKVANFGHAKAKIAGSTAGTSMKGSHYYNAPEILLHTTENVKYPYSEATDVYSFSVVMNEVLSGRKPYTMDNFRLISTMLKNKDTRPPLFDAVPGYPDQSSALRSLITGGWRTDAGMRRTFVEIEVALQNVLKGVCDSPIPDPPSRLSRDISINDIDVPSLEESGCTLS